MSSSPLYVLMQPKISNSYWVSNILLGIDKALVKYRDKLCIQDTSNANGFSDLFSNLYKKPVLLVGNDSRWIEDTVNMLTAYESCPILVTPYMLPIHRTCCNGVVFELEEAVRYCKKYLTGSGHGNIAFLGANSHSVSDIAKQIAFDDSENVYAANSTIEECIDSFLSMLPEKKYNGIICANDTVAICLINRMKSLGYRIPEDCYVIGMGDSCLGANHTTSVSSVMFNYVQMGEQAVHLYHTVAKAPSPCHHTISLPCCFIVRESTGGSTTTGYPILHRQLDQEINTLPKDEYFTGETAQQILELETVFQKCDQTDRQIIFGLVKGKSHEQIAEQVYLTPRAIRYRINNFFKRYTSMTQSDFFTALKNILK